MGWFKRKDDAPAPGAGRRCPEGNASAPQGVRAPAGAAVPDAPQPVRRPGRVLTGKKIDAGVLDQIEELLITSDIGIQTATALIERISAAGAATAEELQSVLRQEILAILTRNARPARAPGGPPHVILVVGVNGVGKTTTIGKLAARFAADGQKVLIAAADTFRAAAVEQLTIWAERAGADIVRHPNGADPASVAFDAVDTALARGCGCRDRRHRRPASHQGQPDGGNQEGQTLHRQEAAGSAARHPAGPGRDHRPERRFPGPAVSTKRWSVTGIALTKLDGTAKGGIVIAICQAFDIPLRYIGIGESIEDLQDFDPQQFVDALFAS